MRNYWAWFNTAGMSLYQNWRMFLHWSRSKDRHSRFFSCSLLPTDFGNTVPHERKACGILAFMFWTQNLKHATSVHDYTIIHSTGSLLFSSITTMCFLLRSPDSPVWTITPCIIRRKTGALTSATQQCESHLLYAHQGSFIGSYQTPPWVNEQLRASARQIFAAEKSIFINSGGKPAVDIPWVIAAGD